MGKVLIQCTDTEGPLMHSGPPPEPAAEVKELTPVIDPPIKVTFIFLVHLSGVAEGEALCTPQHSSVCCRSHT
jgi:hypothetical protein